MKENTLNSILHGMRVESPRYLKLLIICLVLVGAGCKAKKPLVVKKPDTAVVKSVAPDAKIIRLNAIRAAQTNFSTFSGKAKAELNISGSTNDVTLNIRIKKGQEIWVSITALLNVEAARAVITPDSLLVINKLQGIYLKKPFSYIQKYAGSHVNYNTIESLLIGNAIQEMVSDSASLQTKADSIVLTGNLQSLAYRLVVGQAMKVLQTNLNDQDNGQSMQALNSLFVQAGARLMPSQIAISSVVKSKKIGVNLHYIKTDFDVPVQMPFNIPARYEEGK